MPTTYTHYKFGDALYHTLNDDIKSKITKHRQLYDIGLHGPDILFYYKPYKSNAISKLGNQMHHEIAAKFFLKAKKIIRDSNQQDAMLCYIIGFINHFVLDSQCHGYINDYVKSHHVSHAKIETEWDRILLIQDGKNPISAKPTGHIIPSKENAKIISLFFDLKQKDIYHCLKDMKRYLNLLVSPQSWKRKLIKYVITKANIDETYYDLIILPEPDSRLNESNQVLIQKYQEAIDLAKTLIEEYVSTLRDDTINEYFNRNFE